MTHSLQSIQQPIIKSTLQPQQQHTLAQRSPNRVIASSVSPSALSVVTSMTVASPQTHLKHSQPAAQITKSAAMVSTADLRQQITQTIGAKQPAVTTIPQPSTPTHNNLAVSLSATTSSTRASPSRGVSVSSISKAVTSKSGLTIGLENAGVASNANLVESASATSVVTSLASGSKVTQGTLNAAQPQLRQQQKSFMKLSNNVIHHASNNIGGAAGVGSAASPSSLPTSLSKVVNSSSTSSSPSPSSSISSSSSVTGLPSVSNHPSGSPHVAPVAVSLLNGPSK